MLTLLKNPYVILAAFAILTLAYTIGHYNGQAAVRAKQIAETARSAQDAKKTNDAIRSLPDGAAAIELRKHWQR